MRWLCSSTRQGATLLSASADEQSTTVSVDDSVHLFALRLQLESCDEKMNAFEKRQEDLRRVVMDNVDFIRETDKKIEYAEKRIKEEEDEIAETEKQTQALEKELDMFKWVREESRGHPSCGRKHALILILQADA